MDISSAVIIYNPVYQTILAEHPFGRPWKNPDGTPATGTFSLPKGLIEDGEEPIDAAIREIKEECDIDLKKKKLVDLGEYEYTKYKKLHLFFYIDDIDPKKCKCNSYFERDGKEYPEVNGFTLIQREVDLHYFMAAQQKVIKKVMADYPELFV
jgi:predicted NUDIX family NTP pyrophosphohydrolase